MLKPKLIVTDLDGTTLRNDKTIAPETLEAFATCQKAGIPIAIATARYILGAKPFADALHADYQILTDGTLVFENEVLIYSNAMDISVTNSLIKEFKNLGFTSHIAIPTTEGLFRYPCSSMADETCSPFDINAPFPYPANKMVVELPNEYVACQIATKCHCSQLHYRGEDRYTFFHPTASKLDAIRHITNKLNITLEDVLVFGDDLNDIDMISQCGHGVAMGNALDEVKAVADEITFTNEENGVAKVLKQLEL